jgi:hypothetical protein
VNNVSYNHQEPFINDMDYDDDIDLQFEDYKKFKNNGVTFDKKYPTRSQKSFFSSFSTILFIQCLLSSRKNNRTPSSQTYKNLSPRE